MFAGRTISALSAPRRRPAHTQAALTGVEACCINHYSELVGRIRPTHGVFWGRTMRASLPRPRFALGLCAVLALLVATPAAGRSDVVRAKLSYLDNGTIRLGVDLDDGGTITYLARSRTRNADVLHDVQQVYHDGAWQVGAAGGEVVESTNNGKTIYTKVVPRTGDGTPCACVLESW